MKLRIILDRFSAAVFAIGDGERMVRLNLANHEHRATHRALPLMELSNISYDIGRKRAVNGSRAWRCRITIMYAECSISTIMIWNMRTKNTIM